MGVDQNVIALAEAWHAPRCHVDAGGGCILHSDEKEAWIAGYIARDTEVELLIARIEQLLDGG